MAKYLSFGEVWSQLVRKSPSLGDDGAKVEFEAHNLKALLRQVYGQGVKSGKESAPVSTGGGDFFSEFMKG